MGLGQDDGHFRRVLNLVEGVRPWLRGLESNSHEKLHRTLVIHLGKCALNLLGKTPTFDGDLVIMFCCMTLTEYVKSPMKDEVYKENKTLYIIDILDCVARECKVEEGNTGTEFVELVYYCVNKCQIANATTVNILYSALIEVVWQVMTPINSILRLYAAGLLLASCNLKSRTGELASSGNAKFESLLGILLQNEKILQSLSPLLGSLKIFSKSNCVLSSVEDQCFDGHTCMQSGFDCEASMTYRSFCIEALKFLCQPLAKAVNLERKQMVTEKDDTATMTMLSTVQDAFLILCQLILSSPRETNHH
ncbi:Separin [Sesbania bispinosa]|nr:Separin [Sesbania bispinosa]